MIVCESSQKPLMLFHLIHTQHKMHALVFTKSAESTTRLMRLFEFFESARTALHGSEVRQQIVIRAYSSDSGAGERKAILENFKAQKIQMYVLLVSGLMCSDTRQWQSGMLRPDIPRYRHQSCLARHQLRCTSGYAKICSPCWKDSKSWSCRRGMDIDRRTRGRDLP
jgi:ATP-dependent RNA helicase DDX51/DBP6